MAHHHYATWGTCSKAIEFDIEDGKLHNVSFYGGCDGNLRAIGKLVEGADARATADLLHGNRCGRRPTSCADQLSNAIEEALAKA